MSLRDRVRKLEQRAEEDSVPSWEEYSVATTRQRARNLNSAYGKLNPDLPARLLREGDLKLLENDGPEQAEKDRQTVERWRRAQGMADETASHAERARQKLKSMVRIRRPA